MAGSGDDRHTDQHDDHPPDVLADIPWERLREQSGVGGLRPIQWLLVAGGLAVLALGGWWLARNTTTPSDEAPPGSLSAAAVTTSDPTLSVVQPSTPSTSTVTSVPASPTLPGREELLSAPMDRSISVIAEWYVRRYFTDPQSLGLMPQRRTHYVEWVSTRSVTHVDQGRVNVDVLVGTLIESDEGYRRQDVRSVVVPLSSKGSGWQVADLPSEISAVKLDKADPPEPTQPLPPELEAIVVELTGGKVRDGGRIGDRWRVELSVKGLPVAMWVDDNGKQVGPPRPR